jgi:hypothetical protein
MRLSQPYFIKILFSSVKLPLPEKGFKSTNLITSLGTPKNSNIGDIELIKKFSRPLLENSSSIKKIATMQGNIETTKLIAFFAPLVKVE